MNNYGEAAKHLEEAVRQNADDPAAHALLAAALGKLGNSEAQRREQQWLDEHEGGSVGQAASDILPWTRIKKRYDGRAFRLLSLTVGKALEATLANQPEARHGTVHLGRGEKFLSAGRLPEAERELSEAVSLLPRDASAYLDLGQVYELEGRHREAASALETSLKLRDTGTFHWTGSRRRAPRARPPSVWILETAMRKTSLTRSKSAPRSTVMRRQPAKGRKAKSRLWRTVRYLQM
ncbi:MAG: hypothetical protein DMG24_12140 [Acidobacteria bacterium]|nr:MAG: hypothetical protein DMG24_12140 [Acidobacteriota bacterium]